MPHVQYTTENYFNMLQCYFLNNNQHYVAARVYNEMYGASVSANTIRDMVFRLRESGSILPKQTREYDRPVLTAENCERIFDHFEEDPTESTRGAQRELGISKSSIHRALQAEELYPYHYTKVQSLQPADYPLRVDFCNRLIRETGMNETYPARILWSDECTFKRDGMFNSKNSHYWSYENPNVTWETSFQFRWSINVWAGLLDDQLIGPIFLPDRLDGDRYLELLRDQLPDLIRPPGMAEEDLPLNRRDHTFQQDGAPPHFARNVRDYLDIAYPNRWIGRRGPINWPARSPDLTPLDFYLWGVVKAHVYKTKVETRDECEDRINEAFNIIRGRPETIRNATRSVIRRAMKCVEVGGEHFQHLLF